MAIINKVIVSSRLESGDSIDVSVKAVDKPLSLEDMEYQWNTYKRLFDAGEIQGVIVCSNCIADIGIEAADYTKQWIEKNA